MAGYHGFSMSNNAVEAYENGEKPLSKWTKTAIMETIQNAVEEDGLVLKCTMENLKKVPVEKLKELCLYRSSWHHTSKHYNKTDFYSLDLDSIKELTDKQLENEIVATKTKKGETLEERCKCAFLEWSGTRNHPKATEVVEEGVIKGNWFIRADGSKKKVTANGFRIIEKIK